jgi:hypothetical protein
VYAFKGEHGPLAWSPDGKYIISSSGDGLVLKDGHPVSDKHGFWETYPGFAKVWVA